MASITIELEPGEIVELSVAAFPLDEGDEPDPGEEEEDDEYVDKTGTGDRIYPFRLAKAV